ISCMRVIQTVSFSSPDIHSSSRDPGRAGKPRWGMGWQKQYIGLPPYERMKTKIAAINFSNFCAPAIAAEATAQLFANCNETGRQNRRNHALSRAMSAKVAVVARR